MKANTQSQWRIKNQMKLTSWKFTLWILTLVVFSGAVCSLPAQKQPSSYAEMAPIQQYLMTRDAEINLARTAAPESISRDAEVMVLGRQGYETAIQGKNGFVCMVQRSWTAGFDDPEFWNPKLRAPICFNPPGVRSYLPFNLRKTSLALHGRTRAQIFEEIQSAFNSKELPTQEPGSMGYMMSKDAYLGDRDGHWHPHLMFYVPETDTVSWGAGLPGSPILGSKDMQEHLTVFFIPVSKWSDGTDGPPMKNP